MADYNVYRIKGEFLKTQTKSRIPLMMEVRALSPEQALEKVYSEVGSRHRVKRSEILIPKDGGIVVISPSEAKSKLFTDMDKKDFVIFKD